MFIGLAKDSYWMSELPQIKLILPYKISSISASSEIPLQSLDFALIISLVTRVMKVSKSPDVTTLCLVTGGTRIDTGGQDLASFS